MFCCSLYFTLNPTMTVVRLYPSAHSNHLNCIKTVRWAYKSLFSYLIGTNTVWLPGKLVSLIIWK